jgi:peptidyl-tRNA hydrolase, PTH1 family
VILVVGLGNPGPRYTDTRHNVGARVLDELARRKGASGWRSSHRGKFQIVALAGARVGLLKPETFMNLSGESVQPALAFYKLGLGELLVVHDELDLPFGELRLKQGGGDAGHNGLKSITERLGTPEYARLRFGIGHPPDDFRGSGADFVLEAFPPGQRAELDARVAAAADAVESFVSRGLAAAMNTTNQKSKRTNTPRSGSNPGAE